MKAGNKVLMLGNEAIARGAYEAGVGLSAAYPGTPSTEISEALVSYKDSVYVEWSTNEKVAVEVAFGSSLMGIRSMAAMKHVGLNVALDPVFTISYTGVNGGLVLVVADDPGVGSSQNEQDTRMLALAGKLPVLEPSDSQEAKDFMKEAFRLSEKYDRPIILRTTTRLAHSQTLVELGEVEEKVCRPYEKNVQKYVMTPGNAKSRHGEIEKKNQELAEDANDFPINRIEYREKSIGVITSGIAYQYTREALPNTSILKLGMVNPLPEEMIRSFAKEVESLYIIEELEPVIEQQVKAWGISAFGKDIFPVEGEYSAALIREKILGKRKGEAERNLPPRPPVLCPGCPHRSVYHVLKKLKLRGVGDIGCYTLGVAPPLGVLETTVCMGASISNLHGMTKVLSKEESKRWVAVIGDSTFLHTGIHGLLNMVYNHGNGTIFILDNGTTGMTGHQDHAATGLTLQGEETKKVDLISLCKAIGVEAAEEVNALDVRGLEEVAKKAIEREGISVIVAKSPCVLLEKGKSPKYRIEEEACRACGSCRSVGCPAISKMENQKAFVEESLCAGCGLCYQLCPFGAISLDMEEES